MVKTTQHLFVYGTLMQAATGALGHAQRAQLARESRSLGPATLPGAQLYDLGRYPGLVETGEPAHLVHGELTVLQDPQHTFAWLDAYEDVIPGDLARSEYARVEREVRLVRGEALRAWVYVFLKDVTHRRPITIGRWQSAQRNS